MRLLYTGGWVTRGVMGLIALCLSAIENVAFSDRIAAIRWAHNPLKKSKASNEFDFLLQAMLNFWKSRDKWQQSWGSPRVEVAFIKIRALD